MIIRKKARGGGLGMQVAKRAVGGGAFAVSKRAMPQSQVFTDFATPDGWSVRVIDKGVLDGALAESDQLLRKTIQNIRRQQGKVAVK